MEPDLKKGIDRGGRERLVLLVGSPRQLLSLGGGKG